MSRRLRAAGYPPDWPEIARDVKERAGWRCERCGVRHGAWVSRGRGGQIHVHDPEQMRAMGHGKPPFWLRLSLGGRVKVVEVVVQACHLDGVPSNCDPENLRCWCQHCHLAYDLAQHVRNAAATRRASMGTGEMFDAKRSVEHLDVTEEHTPGTPRKTAGSRAAGPR